MANNIRAKEDKKVPAEEVVCERAAAETIPKHALQSPARDLTSAMKLSDPAQDDYDGDLQVVKKAKKSLMDWTDSERDTEERLKLLEAQYSAIEASCASLGAQVGQLEEKLKITGQLKATAGNGASSPSSWGASMNPDWEKLRESLKKRPDVGVDDLKEADKQYPSTTESNGTANSQNASGVNLHPFTVHLRPCVYSSLEAFRDIRGYPSLSSAAARGIEHYLIERGVPLKNDRGRQ